MTDTLALLRRDWQRSLRSRNLAESTRRIYDHAASSSPAGSPTIRPGERVGVLLHRSTGTYVALLALQKAGATFVPIDPADLGRADSEVKVRGRRVDLGEIDNLLLEDDAVAAAATTLLRQGSWPATSPVVAPIRQCLSPMTPSS